MNESTRSRAAPEQVAIDLRAAGPWAGVAVYALAASIFVLALLFELLASSRLPLSTMGLAEVVPAADRGGIAAASSSLTWRAAVLLLAGTTVGAIVVGCLALRAVARSHPRQMLCLFGMGAVVAIGVAVVQSLGSTSPLVELARLLDRTPVDGTPIGGVVLAPKRAGEVIAGGVGIAMASVLLLPRRLTPEVLAERVARLRLVLYASAAMLVTGVLAAHASYAFLASRTTDPAALAPLVEQGTLLTAAFYTLVLGSAYVPAAALLRWAGGRLAEEAVERGATESAADWLAELGLRDALPAQIGRLATVVSPLLGAAVPQALQLLGSG